MPPQKRKRKAKAPASEGEKAKRGRECQDQADGTSQVEDDGIHQAAEGGESTPVLDTALDSNMSVPDYNRNVSLILSRVMDDIGVNKECVMWRRRTHLIKENLISLKDSFFQPQPNFACTSYIFGSQTEGSTTKGLESDFDILTSFDNMPIIQDLKDWSEGTSSHMMIQDETTSLGYCKLQPVRPDKRAPCDTPPTQDPAYMKEKEKNRIILKNTFFINHFCGNYKLSGPAAQSTESSEKGHDEDKVCAFYCRTWPKDYKKWSLRQEVRDWPTPEMVKYMEASGCFVVAVAHRCAERQDAEWRISTSLAERCLMFNLNITQIRCYVILKMVNKTFIKHFVPDVISSYIWKTRLFHTLERTTRVFWREENLLACVNRVLFSMYLAVYNKKCPNYFYKRANLLLGKLDKESTRERLLFILRKLLQSNGRFLLKITCDNINSRMKKYVLNTHLVVQHQENETERLRCCLEYTAIACGKVQEVFRHILSGTNSRVQGVFRDIFDTNSIVIPRYILFMMSAYSNKDILKYKAATMLLPFLCSHIATLEASKRIRHGQEVLPTEFQMMYGLSLNSDAASSRLRYASFLCCTGKYENALSFLQEVKQKMDSGAIQLCCCPGRVWYTRNKDDNGFAILERGNAYPSTSNVGLCVMFSQEESHCCPLEMQFEYYRSTDKDKSQRDYVSNLWMDLAVLDCLPFLYYLQYMAARHLGQRDLQKRALDKLIESAYGERHLGHRETALNVLGQCMEHENRLEDALQCYRISVKQRPRNNAVRWLLARLMFIAIKRRQDSVT